MKRAIPWRLLVYSLLLLGAAFALVQRLGNLEELGRTLQQAQSGPLILAFVLQALTLWNQPALYQALYELVGVPIRWRDLAPLVWTGHFVNVATPSAGLGGTALLMADARARGADLSRVSLANTLYFLFNFAWFAVLLLVGLSALWLHHDLKSYELGAAGVLLTALVLAFAALIGAAWRPRVLERFLLALARFLNSLTFRLFKRRFVPAEGISRFVGEWTQAVYALKSPRALVRPVFHTLWVDGLEILVLGACFWAFPGLGNITPALLVAGYAIGTLFLILSITPQGIGVVEGVMTATFVSLGVPLERATVVVLVYRGLSFWLPLLAGFLISRRVFISSTSANPNLSNPTL